LKQNCWEFKKCGRNSGGARVVELGECPAAIDVEFDGKNGGICAGRCCWKIAGTLCGGKPRGTYAQKLKTCVVCDFFRLVKKEEWPATMF
jgi:hypothetical protein